jgi:hypothetical protein
MQILIVGGSPGGTTAALSSIELYDPVVGTWTNATSLPGPRKYHTATLLPNGKVLVAGGFDGTNYFSSTLLYEPEPMAGVKLVISTPQSGRGFQFAFAAAPNASNTVLTFPDPGLPAAGWTVLGTASEFAPGLFLFTEPQTTGTGPRFYRIRSP